MRAIVKQCRLNLLRRNWMLFTPKIGDMVIFESEDTDFTGQIVQHDKQSNTCYITRGKSDIMGEKFFIAEQKVLDTEETNSRITWMLE